MSRPVLTPHRARLLELMLGGLVLRHLDGGGAEMLGLFAVGRRAALRPFVRRASAERMVQAGLIVCVDRLTGEAGSASMIPFTRREWRIAPSPEPQQAAA